MLRKASQVGGAEEQIRASRWNGPLVIHPRLPGADDDPAQGAGFALANGSDKCGAVEGAHSKLRIGDYHGRWMFVDIGKGFFGVADPMNRKAFGSQGGRPHFGRVITMYDQHGSHKFQPKRWTCV